MKIGDYVRTKEGNIYKIAELGYNNETFLSDTNEGWFLIYKSSPNIIDLIEVGDYVNGYQVFRWHDGDLVLFDSGYSILKEIKITSIVTKEQFERMQYEVEVC